MLRCDVGAASFIRSPSLSKKTSYHLSNLNTAASMTASGEPASRSRLLFTGRRRMERETGIEPATNSLEGCDSTTELLPPSFTHFAPNFGEGSPPSVFTLARVLSTSLRWWLRLPSACPARSPPRRAHSQRDSGEAKAGGEGRTRTFEAARATDLQSAAFDRFATSPIPVLSRARGLVGAGSGRTSR